MQTTTITTKTLIEDYLLQNGYHLIANAGFNDAGSIFAKDEQALIFYDNVIEYKRRKKTEKPNIINVLFKWETVASYRGFEFTEFNLMMLLDMMGAVKLKDVNKQLRQTVMMQNAALQINEMALGNPVVERNAEMV